MARILWMLAPLAAFALPQLVQIECVAAKGRAPKETTTVDAMRRTATDADRIAAGDTLEIIADPLVPKETYRIQANDRLKVTSTMKSGEEAYGFGRVDEHGLIDNWRIKKKAIGLTLAEFKAEFRAQYPQFGEIVSVEVVESGDSISGSYFMSSDCTPWLPGFGSIAVNGRSAEEAKLEVEQKLSEQFESPNLSVRLAKQHSEGKLDAAIQVTPDPFAHFARAKDLAAVEEEPQRIEYRIAIVEDRENALAEFDDVRTDPNDSCIDSETILPALRIMAKHNVIKMRSLPRIVCQAGEAVNFQTIVAAMANGDDIATNELKFEIYGGRMDGETLFTYQIDVMHDGVRTAGFVGSSFTNEDGKTLLIKAHPHVSGKETSTLAVPVYVVVTPQVISGADKRRRGFGGFIIAQ